MDKLVMGFNETSFVHSIIFPSMEFPSMATSVYFYDKEKIPYVWYGIV